MLTNQLFVAAFPPAASIKKIVEEIIKSSQIKILFIILNLILRELLQVFGRLQFFLTQCFNLKILPSR